MVCNPSVLTQPTHLWRAWCTQGQPAMCQLKPRHNLRDLMKPAISSSFYSPCLNSFSLPLSLYFFLIRWDFIRPPLSVTAIGCEISEGKACGNHSISYAHLAQHLYRGAGGFWKGEKSFTKSISETGLTQTDSGNTFIPCSTSSLCFLPVLCLFTLHTNTARLHQLIVRSIYDIKK